MTGNQTSNSRQAAWVAIGSFFSFVVGIVSPMILSRYFDKADYGTYKQVMYVYNTLLTIFTLGLPKAYAFFLPKYATEYSRDIISKVTKIFFVLGAVFTLFLLCFAGPIAKVMNNPELKTALVVFSPTPFLLLPTMGLDAIYASFRKTKYLAYYTIATRVLTIVCIVLPVVLFSGNYIQAIIGFDVASLLTFFLALYLKSLPVKNVPQRKSDLTYKEIFSFALPLLYASLWGMIIISANQFFISRYFGNETFAEFSNGFMEIPFAAMILGSISAVLLPVFSGMDRGNGMGNETLRIWNSALLKSAKLLFPMLIFSVFFAEPIMTCMYGDIYSASAIYFIIKNLSGLFVIIPFYPIILAIGKTKEYAHVHMVIAFVVVLSEYIVCKTCASAVYIAVTSEICQLLKIWLLMRVIANYAQRKIIDLVSPRMMGSMLLVSVLASLPPFLLFQFIEINKWLSLFCSLLFFLIDYYALCWFFKVSYRDIVGGFIHKGTRIKSLLQFIP